ncbi:hypothetical protein Tco_0808927 [Tanacetum coccineum]
MSLIRKWKWRFLVENNALWRMVIKDFYGIDGGFGSPHNSFGSRGIWCDIIKADPWCPNGLILKYTFPKLFALETYKDSKVADRWKFANGHWGGNWSRHLPPRWRAIDDLSTLEGLISSLVRESDGEDKWVWKGDASKSFKVKFLSKSIQNLLLANDIIDSHCLWNSWIPKKEIDHCIIRCPRAIAIWRKVWSWWNLSISAVFPSFSIPDITIGRIKVQGSNARTNKILQGVLCCTIWSIWNWRNRIMNAGPIHVDRVLDEDIFASIQRVSKIWISGRVKSLYANESTWISRPFDIMSTS